MRWGSWKREVVVCAHCCGGGYVFDETCGWCGRPFSYHGQGRRRYCDEGCRRRASALRAGRLAQPRIIDCVECGRPFEARRADAHYCGAACRQHAYRRRHPVAPAPSG
jgi:hypothetical protein